MLQEADATAAFRFLGLPPELRDEVYCRFFVNEELRYFIFMNRKQIVAAENRQCLQRVPEQIRNEVSAVFHAVLRGREAIEKTIDGIPSSGNIRIGVDLEYFLGTVSISLVWISQMPNLLPLCRLNQVPCLMNRFTNRVADIRPRSHCLILKSRTSSTTDFVPVLRSTLKNGNISS